ncbi:ABC transporter substrate-binding protein [Lentzea sp. NBRC 105346]|uniref:ABC transporter substrate-binding protein n=1 Tax=Lentzea sp. NBRC 105346 TaxID=3032205 RepID=UPI0024A1AAED|nr:ABC transporter substrate-binding protein [Lentzea sp. NBRC 105346]GLZ33743.1 ABC transporter substrate-binding protein [Lentzea sp. NBRC 105346]
MITRRELFRAGLFLGCALSCSCTDEHQRQVSSAALGPRKSGGVLRIGVTGGSTEDSLDPHKSVTYPDQARMSNLYEPLFRRDASYQIEPVLASSLEPSAGLDEWTLRLRSGVFFHNGKALDADDVIFSLRRIMELPGMGASALQIVDLGSLRKIDPLTLRIKLTQPHALFQDELAQYYLGIVPVGFDLRTPVGTGPFRFGSFVAGSRSSFPRFDRYWRPHEPYVDELVIIDFPDEKSRLDALLSGSVEAIDNLPQTQVAAVKAAGVNVLISESGNWSPFTMRVDTPPFDNVLVRQAFRLIVDRDQMVSQALRGQGRVGNDLYAPFDQCFAKDLPQRRQDLKLARSLLAQAGHTALKVELVTSDAIGAGVVAAARLFAEQARGAGVEVAVREVDAGVFYGKDDYLRWPFAQDFWYTRSYLPQVAQGSLPDAPYNECHWQDPRFMSLIAQARSEADRERRCGLLREAQKIEYESGGYIVWSFKNQVDAYSSRVTGFVPDRNLPLSSFQFRSVSFV